MKLSIRLQNHGCANHPYWWIVVAPNRKNIRGRFIEHVGYWCPRERVMIKRQVTLNLPRVKHWISQGAVPSPRIQRFLAMYNIMPVPWYFKKDRTVNFESLTEEQQQRELKKQKRRERIANEEFNPINYYDSVRLALNKYKGGATRKIINAVAVNQRQNDILRELLISREFQKIQRVAELNNGAGLNVDAEIKRVKGEAECARAELAMLQRLHRNSRPMLQIQVMQKVIKLEMLIKELQRRKPLFNLQEFTLEQSENLQISNQETLEKKIYYQLITKKLIQLNEDMIKYANLGDIVTKEQYAQFLFKHKFHEKKEAYRRMKAKMARQQKEKQQQKWEKKKNKRKMANSIGQEEEQILEAEEVAQQAVAEEEAVQQTTQEAKQQEVAVEEGEQQVEEDKELIPPQWTYPMQLKGLDDALPDQDGVKPEQEVVQNKKSLKSNKKQGQSIQDSLRKEKEEMSRMQKQSIKDLGFMVCMRMASDTFDNLAITGQVMTKKDLFDELNAEQRGFRAEEMEHFFTSTPDQSSTIKKALFITREQCIPTLRPVNPFPDLESYLPNEYYEPIVAYNMMIKKQDTVEPYDQVLKYQEKKKKTGLIDSSQPDHSKIIQEYLQHL